MNRRNFLRLSPVLLSLAAVPLRIEAAIAAPSDVVRTLIYEKSWTQPETFAHYRRLSAVFTKLRIAYNGPRGYESGARFRQEVWEIWERAFGKPSETAYRHTIDTIASRLNGMAPELESQMQQLLAENDNELASWLEEIGVLPSGKLGTELVRAQGCFAIAAVTQISEGDLTAFSDDSWVYPFC